MNQEALPNAKKSSEKAQEDRHNGQHNQHKDEVLEHMPVFVSFAILFHHIPQFFLQHLQVQTLSQINQ